MILKEMLTDLIAFFSLVTLYGQVNTSLTRHTFQLSVYHTSLHGNDAQDEIRQPLETKPTHTQSIPLCSAKTTISNLKNIQ